MLIKQSVNIFISWIRNDYSNMKRFIPMLNAELKFK